ncbi:MAG: glycosyltransferase [Hymenobacteraceae bacterium]|nr:glycosyltransferase [Hymenobacteraceae bacterium]
MSWLLLLSTVAYGWIILRRWYAWRQRPVQVVPAGYQPVTKVSVIIPVRNEAANIVALLQDLERQNYPKELMEVIVVDDHSEDNTIEVILEYALGSTMSISWLSLKDHPGAKLKKGAVQKGVEAAAGELLVLTDGDCRVGVNWLRQYACRFEQERPYFISGPVCFHHTASAFEKMQLVEFASLIGVGGASIGLKRPNMCNGANLAYTKEAFRAVGGFAGNEGVASGDDEFLLHKVHAHFPGKVSFLKSDEAIVYTEARKTLVSFLYQRVRWASKWRAYQQVNVQLVALVVFAVNLLLFVAIPLVLWGRMPLWAFVSAYVAKCGVDFLFLDRILSFMGTRKYLWYMLPLQLVYIPYVVITAVFGLFGRYSWKGRPIRNT